MSERDQAAEIFERIRALSIRSGRLGVTRPSYSDVETGALVELVRAAGSMGLKTAYDLAGNIWVGTALNVGEPYVLTGSHVDSVADGGNYDGLAGVVAGLLVIARMKSKDVRLVALRGEESAWFGQPYKGSKAIFGKLVCGDDLRRAMEGQGAHYVGSQARGLVDTSKIRAFVELHIEQGPVLHTRGVPVAAVTSIAGNIRYQVTVVGEAGHSGTTPMAMRKDAVRCAVALLDRAYQICIGGTTTCGVIHTDAAVNAGTRVPEVCGFSVEYRSDKDFLISKFHQGFLELKASIEYNHSVAIDVKVVSRSAPVVLDPPMCRAIELIVGEPGMPSGAGHDAAIFQENGVPSGMIFVKNANGSHNPNEHMYLDDFMVGVDVLEKTLRELIK